MSVFDHSKNVDKQYAKNFSDKVADVFGDFLKKPGYEIEHDVIEINEILNVIFSKDQRLGLAYLKELEKRYSRGIYPFRFSVGARPERDVR